jgi:addiction module HigA family antidote
MHTMTLNPLTAGLAPTHPGEILREDVLPALGLGKAEAARLMGVSRQTVHQILDGKRPLSPEMALRFARLTGWDADFLMALQAGHDLRIARAGIEAELAAIATVVPPEPAPGPDPGDAA